MVIIRRDIMVPTIRARTAVDTSVNGTERGFKPKAPAILSPSALIGMKSTIRVLTYLAARKRDFYKVESTVDGKHFVTARGWDDLSEMIKLYEAHDLKVDELLISQYIQTPKIAKDFAIYYDLFRKYRSDYKIDAILAGRAGEDVLFRAQRAQMDERMSFLGLLFDAVTGHLRETCGQEDMLDLMTPVLKEVKASMTAGGTAAGSAAPAEIMEECIARQQELLDKGKKASAFSPNKQKAMQRMIAALEGMRAELLHAGIADGGKGFEIVQDMFRKIVAGLKKSAEEGSACLSNAFDFCERAFENEEKAEKSEIIKAGGDEILVFVTELTVNYYTARFIGHYGCDQYYMHNKELQFAERQVEIARQVEELEWDL